MLNILAADIDLMVKRTSAGFSEYDQTREYNPRVIRHIIETALGLRDPDDWEHD